MGKLITGSSASKVQNKIPVTMVQPRVDLHRSIYVDVIVPSPNGSLEQMLAQHPFLTGLEPGYLEFMSQEATIVTFDSDQHILLEGREANDFYLIHQGEVALKTFLSPSEGFAKIQQLSAGDIIGWSWFVSPYHWQFSAFATKPTTVIALDGKRLRDKSEADHEFGYALQKRLLPVIGQRLQMTKKGLD